MESIQNVKRRLKGVKNIGQITKAMELVAATKMRRAQEIALASRPYALASLELLANLAEIKDIKTPPLLEKRRVEKTLFLLIASDKGLAGAFNSSLFRKFENFAKNEKINLESEKNLFAAVGQKSANYIEKRGVEAVQSFIRAGDFTSVEEVKPITDLLIQGYLEKKWDKVLAFSTHFRSALKQEPLVRQILPVEFENLKATVKEIIPESGRFAELAKEMEIFAAEKTGDYLIEPSPEIVLEELVPHLVLMQIYHLILEANASEHSARRMAMKNASENADDLSVGLTLEYNKSRQAAITKEIVEVTSGAEALK